MVAQLTWSALHTLHLSVLRARRQWQPRSSHQSIARGHYRCSTPPHSLLSSFRIVCEHNTWEYDQTGLRVDIELEREAVSTVGFEPTSISWRVGGSGDMRLRRLISRWASRVFRSPLVFVTFALGAYVLIMELKLRPVPEFFPAVTYGTLTPGTVQGTTLQVGRNVTEVNTNTTSTSLAVTTYLYNSGQTTPVPVNGVLLAGHPRPRKIYLTIGIPTLRRPKGDYFMATVDSLIGQSTEEQQQETTVVVILADRNSSFNEEVLQKLKESYSTRLQEGYLLVIRAPNTDHIFKDDNLKRTFNDSVERVRWRSKQNMDYAALMEFAVPLSTYYMQLEDDVLAAPNYHQHIRDFVDSHTRQDWAGLEVSPHGFIGKLFKNNDLPKLVTVLRTFYLEQPCDFLVSHFYKLMVQKAVIRRRGTLFFHQGKYSSLESVVRKVDTVTETVGVKKMKVVNPAADLYTTMNVYKTYTLEKAYDVTDGNFFWASDIEEGDTITVVFKEPQKVERIVVESGFSDKNHRDMLHNASLEVGHAAMLGKESAVCTNTTEVGDFVDGHFEVRMPLNITEVQCFSIVVMKTQSEWVVLREIAVFVIASVSRQHHDGGTT